MGYAVASGHDLTTAAAAEVLAAGGTAVDACLAAAAVTFIAEPVLSQPLGGGVLLWAPAEGAPQILDAFVDTPARAVSEGDLDLKTITVDFGTATQDFHIGAGTIAVPCLMPGLMDAHARFGRMPLPELFKPAIDHMRGGVALNAFHALVHRLVAPILKDTPEVAALYAPGDGDPVPGTIYGNSDMADVLEVLALEGPRFFTEGEVASALAALPGSHLTREEIAAAQPVWRKPLTLTRLGAQIALNPPPSLGGVQIALNLSALPPRPGPATVAAGLAEVARIRRALDLDKTPETAAARALDPKLVADLKAILANHRPATRGTTHISVTDREGNGAALTLTNGESCGRLLPGTGLLPNNMLGEEDLVPGGPLAWTPGRRLATMMCPTAIRRDKRLTMLGSGGSNRIRSALATTMLELIDHTRRAEDAISAPRLHVEGNALSFEDTGGEAQREMLLGDWPEATVWSEPSMYFGGVHIAACDATGENTEAAGDPRRAGAAAIG